MNRMRSIDSLSALDAPDGKPAGLTVAAGGGVATGEVKVVAAVASVLLVTPVVAVDIGTARRRSTTTIGGVAVARSRQKQPSPGTAEPHAVLSSIAD